MEDETKTAGEKAEAEAIDQNYAKLLERPIVHPDIANLLRPLTKEEYEGLEESIKREGCRDPIVFWKEEGILLGGYNRHEICTRLAIPLRKTEISLPDLGAAVEWVTRDQLARRNLTPIQRCLLALKLEPVIAARAKAHQREAGGAVPQKSKEPPIETCMEIAKLAGTSTDTVRKVKKIEECATEDVKQRVQNGDLSIDKASKLVWELRRSAIWKLRTRLAGKDTGKDATSRTILTELKRYLETFRVAVRGCGTGILILEHRQAFITEVDSFLSEIREMLLGHTEELTPDTQEPRAEAEGPAAAETPQ